MFIAGGNAKQRRRFGRQYQILIKFNINLPYNPANPHLGTYPSELKIHVHMKSICECLEHFIDIVKNWKQPRCPLSKWKTNQGTSIGWNTIQ